MRESTARDRYENEPAIEHERSDSFYKQYEMRDISVESIRELLNTLKKIAADPQSLVRDCIRQEKELDKIIDEEIETRDQFFNDLEVLASEYEELTASGIEDSEAEGQTNKRAVAFKQIELRLAEADKEYRARSKKVDGLLTVREEMRSLIEFYKEGGFPHTESFYCESSDNLPAIREKIDVKDRQVATVASNGDFWQIFAEGGAREIKVFDISLPALLYTELKLVGLENLDYEDYLALVGRGANDLNARKDREERFFSPVIYQKIRDRLTVQAQAYFDGLLDDESNDLFRTKRFHGFAKYRSNEVFIGDLIKTKEEYKRLQSRSKTVKYVLNLGDVMKESSDLAESDIIYLSNVGYKLDKMLEFVASLLRKGARAIISTNMNRLVDYLGISTQSLLGRSKINEKTLSALKQKLKDDLGLDVQVLGNSEKGEGGIILEIKKRQNGGIMMSH
jgi:hypothetical protein